jgi:hypothetical protein
VPDKGGPLGADFVRRSFAGVVAAIWCCDATPHHTRAAGPASLSYSLLVRENTSVSCLCAYVVGATTTPAGSDGQQQLFDILPISGHLEPGGSEVMEVSYFASPGSRATASAVCLVADGPEYKVGRIQLSALLWRHHLLEPSMLQVEGYKHVLLQVQCVSPW